MNRTLIPFTIYTIGKYVYKIQSISINRKIIESGRKFIQILYSGYYASQLKSVGLQFRLGYPVKFIYGAQYICIGNFFTSFPQLRLEAIKTETKTPHIIIGDNVSMGYNYQINCIDKIVIGNNVLFGSNIFITDHFHGASNIDETYISPNKRALYSKGPVVIDDNVWIGQNVSVMPNVVIGEGCIIGANSVVTHDIPAFSIAAGCPAKIIKRMK